MEDPSYIPEPLQVPLIVAAWLLLLAMILWDRRKLNKALRERPSLKVHRDGEWHTVPAGNFFDQDAYAQQPVAHRVEPQIRTEIPRPPKGHNS